MGMEKRSIPTAQSLLFFAFTITSLSSQIIVAIPTDPRRLVINLIHRDSAHSPYHKKNENFTTRLQRTMATNSIYLQELEKLRRSLPTIGFHAELVPSDDGLFLVNFSIGQPPVPQLAIMDTGSSLLWVQCSPCVRCSKQYSPIFNSDKSSTFTTLPCTSEYCIFPKSPYTSCTSSDPCNYHQTYAKAVDSLGVLAKEQLIFHTSDRSSVVMHDVMFGCSDMNGDIRRVNRLMSGVFGLGFLKISLATRFSKFSYCIGNVLDPNYIHNKLVLGTGGWTEGDSTPLQVIDGRYHVVLENISIGEKSLPIDLNQFRWINGEEKTGVIIDSGSVATYLIKEGYDAVLKEVHNLLDTWLTEIHETEDALCYRGTINEDLVGFPTVTFHFCGGAELVLETHNLFFQFLPNELCLAVQPSYANKNLGNLSIIGLFAQQNYNVAYDIFGNTVSFERIDCELLDE